MKTLPENIYHRVYQLVKRNIDLRIIAATLNLPLRTVLNVIARIEKSGLSEKQGFASIDEDSIKPKVTPFLDNYLVPRNRYSILQLVGFITTDTRAKLEQELLVVKLSSWKILAIQLSEITNLDVTGANILLDFCMEMKSRDRYIAILDPPMDIEAVLSELQFESKVPIFGTKWAFEEEALNNKNTMGALNSKNRGVR
jgi:anti-anti-sigma regulatory factor